MTTWLLVSGDFTPLGGMDYANHALAKYVGARSDAEVHLVTHRAWDDLAALPAVTVHRVWRPLNSHLAGMPLLARAGRRWARRLRFRQARVIVNGGNCAGDDVTWVHYVHAAYRLRSAANRLYRLKTWATHHYHLASENQTLRRARLVLCNSRRTCRDVVERVGVAADRARVVYYGVDPVRFGPVTPAEREEARAALGWKYDRPVATFVGALGDRRKGFDTLFAAWKILCANARWDCDLAVVGSGAEANAWQGRARENGLAKRTRFLGFRRDVPRILAASDVVVHPARYEAYGLGVHEALCRGVPALVSADAGVAERYPAELQSLLIPNADDPTDLADRLRFWRENLERFQAELIPFSDALRGHTWDDMARRIVQEVHAAA
jgi:glycosyltransferase involved in cell wall biosynthesis